MPQKTVKVGALNLQAGYVIGENGRAIADGVVCKCDNATSIFCPMHGPKEAEERADFNSQVDESHDGLLA
jgi:hypothetical protein